MIAITGASGFLGSRLLLQGHKIKSNLLDFPELRREIRAVNPSTILHLAAVVGGIKFNSENPIRLLTENIEMTANLFKAADGVRRVITIGSTCAYPKNAHPPFRTYDYWNGYPEESNSAYAIAKRVTCEIGEAYAKSKGIEHCHIILANLYGPGDRFDTDDSHVIPAMIRKFCSGGDVELWGDGNSKREFLYVDDASRAIEDITAGGHTGLINVGSGEVITIKQLARLIAKLCDFKGKIWFNGKLSGQRERLLCSTYQGKTPLEVGLINTINYYRSLDINQNI